MPKARRKRSAAAGRAPKARRPRARPSASIDVALAGLAHDIRTPLAGIIAFADLLQSAGLAERERRWAAAIKGAAEHLARLTTQVVDSAKADASGLVLRAEPFSPRELAQSAAASLAARAESKGLEVRVAISRQVPRHAVGDAVRLRSALENLIDNAVKFTERGRVSLSAAAEPAERGRVRLIFTVADSGIGIVAADLKRLFRPFAQANQDVARRYGGAGLGLALVKRIARAMHGTLTVHSKPGAGSTFRLTVRVAKDAPVGSRKAAPVPRSRSLRILCVEDNPYGRVVMNAVLGELGHRVSFVASGEAAVEMVAAGGHDAVLMDVALPGIDGIEAARRIRALPPPAGQTVIVALSGRDQADDEAAARAAGMDAYLRKPASPATLAAALQAVSRGRPR